MPLSSIPSLLGVPQISFLRRKQNLGIFPRKKCKISKDKNHNVSHVRMSHFSVLFNSM